MTLNNISISVCVPALNEEKALKNSVEDLIGVLSSHVKELEVIIVDDGSADSTAGIADILSEQYCQIKVIHHKKNSGIGVCYRDGLKEAKGQYFTWFPADHENSAEEFIQCLPYLSQNSVVTSHHHGHDKRPALRRFISYTYTWILNRCFNLNIRYYNGLAIFPAPVLRSFTLFSDGFALTAETIIRATQKGCKVTELIAPLKERKSGKSKALTLRSIIRMLKDVLCILSKGRIKF